MLSEYENGELAKLNEYKRRALARSPRQLIPGAVRRKASELAQKADDVPAISIAKESTSTVVSGAASGATKFMTKSSQLTTSSDRVVRAYTKRGHKVEDLDDIRLLDLRAIDQTASFSRMHFAYATSVAAEGAATGFAVSGGQILASAGTVAGAGAGAAPGLGTIAGAMGIDAAILLAAASRVVAHHALYYGYYPHTPAEELFMMQVIGLAMAPTASAKVAAFQQLTVLTKGLATNAAWTELNKQTLTRVAKRFATEFSQRLTKKKLGQLVPVVGIGISAALNYRMIDQVADSAYWAYRERFLGDKGAAAITIEATTDGSDDGLDLVDMLNDEGIQID